MTTLFARLFSFRMTCHHNSSKKIIALSFIAGQCSLACYKKHLLHYTCQWTWHPTHAHSVPFQLLMETLFFCNKVRNDMACLDWAWSIIWTPTHCLQTCAHTYEMFFKQACYSIWIHSAIFTNLSPSVVKKLITPWTYFLHFPWCLL